MTGFAATALRLVWGEVVVYNSLRLISFIKGLDVYGGSFVVSMEQDSLSMACCPIMITLVSRDLRCAKTRHVRLHQKRKQGRSPHFDFQN